MSKLFFIIVLFFSTSVFSETWTKTSDNLGLEYWQSSGYEVVDVQLLVKSNINSSFNQIYTLTHPEGGFKICTVQFEAQTYGPVLTTCHTEYVID